MNEQPSEAPVERREYVSVAPYLMTAPDGSDWQPLGKVSLTEEEAASFVAYGTARRVEATAPAADKPQGTPGPSNPTAAPQTPVVSDRTIPQQSKTADGSAAALPGDKGTGDKGATNG